MRLAGQAKGGYYPTPNCVVDMITTFIKIPRDYDDQVGVRILDPCCGAGDALARLKHGFLQNEMTRTETYGVELNRKRGAQATEKLDNTLITDIFDTAIANRSFNILYLNPPYDTDSDEGNKRLEHTFLTQTTRYLTDHGILVFIVPRRQIATSARYLAMHYRNIRVFAFPEPEREAFDQVVLFGVRKMFPSTNEHGAEKLRETAKGNPPTLHYNAYQLYDATKSNLTEILFSTRTIDPLHAATEARAKGLWADNDITDTLWPITIQRSRPLMPLRKGHLAMLIAAGFLDNLVLEDGDDRILVKGRTTKEVQVTHTEHKEIHREHLKTTVVALDLNSGQILDITAQKERPQ